MGNAVSGTEEHLVGCLTAEGGVGETRVVLVHIERHQLLEPDDRVERVQEQPLVFERSPPRFDERVGKRNVGHGKQSLEEPGIDQFVDGTVVVLDTAVNEESRFLVDQSCGS